MGWIKRLFGKEELAEDDTGVNPIKSKIHDEIQLCKACPFAGKCEWPAGCTSFRKILDDRAKIASKIRGCKPVTQEQLATRRSKRGYGYLVGIGWRIQTDHNQYRNVRVAKVIDESAEAIVLDYDNTHVPRSRLEHTVKIPLMEDVNGEVIVDLRKFRSAVRAALSEWRPG